LEWEVKRDESAVFVDFENRVGVSGGEAYLQLVLFLSKIERRHIIAR